MSQIPQRHFPRIDYDKIHNKERLRLVYMYAQYDSEQLWPDNIGESANQVFSSGNTGPQPRVARMGHDHKTDAIFFRLVSRSVSETKIIFFLNENVFI